MVDSANRAHPRHAFFRMKVFALPLPAARLPPQAQQCPAANEARRLPEGVTARFRSRGLQSVALTASLGPSFDLTPCSPVKTFRLTALGSRGPSLLHALEIPSAFQPLPHSAPLSPNVWISSLLRICPLYIRTCIPLFIPSNFLRGDETKRF